MRGLFSKLKRSPGRGRSDNRASSSRTRLDDRLDQLLSTRIEDNLATILNILDDPDDLVIRRLVLERAGLSYALVFLQSMVDVSLVNEQIIRRLQAGKADSAEAIGNELLPVHQVAESSRLDETMHSLLAGDTLLMAEGRPAAWIVASRNYPDRSVEEPVTEALVRGPRDGFTESIQTNNGLIRKRIRDVNLRVKSVQVGRRSRSKLMMYYVHELAHPDVVREVERRIQSIDIDIVEESGTVEQLIEDSFLSPFAQVQHTERPDRVCTALMLGKVALMLEGTPFALIVPVNMISLLHSPEDLYERWMIGTLIRILRFGAAFAALFLPGLYIALVSFHPGMIPSNLAFSIAHAREGVPFPAFLEAIIMEVTLELLREAGVRLPKPVGPAIGIVGGLVIGEAAVTAGIVSPIMVIVVAITAMASFAMTSYSFAITLRSLRFIVMCAAAVFGFYGVVIVYILINIHLANLKSFGVPYTVPFAPAFYADWKDVVLRAPLTMLRKRPAAMQPKDRTSQGGGEA